MKSRIIFIEAIFFFSFLSFRIFALDREDDVFYKAVDVYSEGRYKESEKLFNSFIKSYPDSFKMPSAELYLAKSLYFQGNYKDTIRILNSIVGKEDYKNVYDETYYWLSKTYYILGDYSKAFKYIEKIIKDYPNSYFIWKSKYLLAQLYLKNSRGKDALVILKEIINSCRENEIVENAYLGLLYLLRKYDDYKEINILTSQYLDKNPTGKLQDKMHFYRAESYYKDNEYNKAIEEYTFALSITDDRQLKDLIHQKRGLSFLAQGDLTQAEKDFSNIYLEEYKLFSYGVYYFNKKEYSLSLDKLSKFLEKFSESEYTPLAYLYKAEIFYRMGRIKDALSIYKDIIDNCDKYYYKSIADDAYYGLGWCYIKDGDFKKAIQAFQHTAHNTNNLMIKITSEIQIANSYKNKGKLDKAVRYYKNILENYPDSLYSDYIYFQIGMIMIEKHNWEEALSNFSILKNNFPSSSLIPEVLYYTGVVYLSKKDFREAQNAFLKFTKCYQGHRLFWQSYYLYGEALLGGGLYRKAVEVFSEVLKRKEKGLEELSLLGMIEAYYGLSDFNNVIKKARKFLRLFPYSDNIPFVYLYLGKIYEAQSDFSKAEYFYELIIEEYNNSEIKDEAMFSLGVLYFNKGYLDKAQYYFNILRETSLREEAQMYIAKIFIFKGKGKEALEIYREISKTKNKFSKEALLEEAFLLKEMKRYDEAENIFKEIIRVGESSPRIHFAFGFCLEKLNKLEEAIEEYYKVVYNSNSTEDKIKAYFRLARIYERKDDIEKARGMYNKIISTGYPEAKVAEKRLSSLIR